MDEAQRQELLEAIANSTKNDTKSPELARKVLISRGLLTKSGKLPKRYRQPEQEKTPMTDEEKVIARDQLIGHPDRTYRHKKRATLYEVQGLATLQIEGPHDMTECVAYWDLQSGRMWVRPVSEFLDGRFERVSS